jgi:hypothetical protein
MRLYLRRGESGCIATTITTAPFVSYWISLNSKHGQDLLFIFFWISSVAKEMKELTPQDADRVIDNLSGDPNLKQKAQNDAASSETEKDDTEDQEIWKSLELEREGPEQKQKASETVSVKSKLRG